MITSIIMIAIWEFLCLALFWGFIDITEKEINELYSPKNIHSKAVSAILLGAVYGAMAIFPLTLLF